MPIKSEFPSVPVADQSFSETVLNAVWKHAVERPDQAAFICAETNESISYLDLYTKTLSVSAFLEQRHFGHGDLACVVLSNCWEYYSIFLGVSTQGGTMSGASYLFTDYELERQFKDSQSKIVFCGDDTLGRVLKAAKNCPLVQTVVVVPKKGSKKEYPFGVVTFDEVIRCQPNLHRHQVDHDLERDILILPYSSGTTGSPKGVMLSHKNFGTMVNILMAHIDREITPHIQKDFDWTAEHSILFLPFYHIYGFGVVNNIILRGSTGIIMSHFDQDVFCRSIQHYKIRLLLLVPPILVFLAKHPIVQKYDLSSVTYILCGAAPAGKDICEEVQKKHPNVKHITQGYGMTEVSMASHFPVIRDDPKFGNAGKLASNLTMKIVDPETRKEVPEGERGEICISGPTVMMGYLNRPQATAETIDDEGWLRTGDIGYVDKDGYLFIVDRLKELIKVKGLQVPPAELEDLLLTHPLIQDAAVIGIPHEKDGEHPLAFIVRASDSLKEDEVKEFIKARVAHYKQLKGGVYFIPQIPKSAAGKILRRFLRDEAEAIRSAGGKQAKL